MLTGSRLLLLLRAGDETARSRVLEELRDHGGDVSRTAAALGVSTDSLYRAAARDVTFGIAWRAIAMGRAGARAAAVRSRVQRARGRRAPQSGETAPQPGGTDPEKK